VTRWPPCLAELVLGLALVVLSGCAADPREGWSTASTFPQGVASVRVPVFENYTFERGLEDAVTEAVIKEFQRSSGLRVVQGEGADSTLHGIIRSADLRRLTVQRGTGLVQEMAYTVTIDFEWKDARTGRVLASRRGFSSADTFVPALPAGERIETGRDGAAQRLARDLVAELRSEW
jgi:TolB-like protein